MIRHFFDILFEAKDPAHLILCWRLRDHVSSRFTEPGRAASFVSDFAEQDMYVGVGLSAQDLGPRQRATEDQVAALIGYCVDVDFQTSTDKPNGKKRPPQDKALELIKTMPLLPTLIVYTGHGYHGWWLFREPYTIDSPEERVRIKSLSTSWGQILQRNAKSHGWDVDSVFDLARVMRIPGTMNCKDPQHKIATSIVSEEAGARLSGPDEIEQFLPTDWELWSNSTNAPSGTLILDKNAEPPFEKYQVLRNNDDKFRLSCDRKRKDLSDSSGSGYDMSLAAITVRAGWTDQEICNLMIATRRQANDELKLNRSDYYERTINKARMSVAQVVALDALATTEAGDKDAKKKVCDALGGIPIQRIIRYMSPEGGTYYIVANGQHVPIGGSDALFNQRIFLNRVGDVTGIVKPPIKAEHWWPLAQLIRDMAEDESFGDEGSETALLKTWLTEYLDSYMPTSDCNTAAVAKGPFIKDGFVHIYLNKFADYVEFLVREKRTHLRLRVSMRALGAETVTVSAQIEGRFTTRGYWRLPSEFSARFVNQTQRAEEPILSDEWPK